MVRLTADLIGNSLTYLNPLKEREIDLRGHRIPAIENLGVAGPLEAIDLTDNDIHVLGNIPLSPRLTTILLARNKIATIQPTLPMAIPSLKNVNLTSNQLAELSDLDVLGEFPRLTHLTMIDNPVTKKEHYRLWVIWRCPTVRFFDFKKVKDSERTEAKELFGTAENPTELAQKVFPARPRNAYQTLITFVPQIMGVKSKNFGVGASANGATDQTKTSKIARLKLTEEEKKKLAEIVNKATSMEEIERLERSFMEGRIPAGILAGDGDAMEE
ncbi:leucine-rich repeat-domain-containing protein [Rhypophila decipiens]|uniref:U2 small nuclear ribonucleoprotein A' n=1 Tax=Rhypophila decipiens TaxID=261697 RepID=A0AAN6Y788_9PEZI|nr:leucine-rich repeat-domain-containing protein [Rhypophila decipiens]